MENFHIDILENILKRLTSTEALPATQVCKTWKAFLADRLYKEGGFLVSYHIAGKNQVQLYYGEQYDRAHGDVDHRKKMMNYFYGKFTGGDHLVVGSCNGLVCLREFEQYLICNPLTGEYVFVPRFNNDLQRRDGQLVPPESVTSGWDGLLHKHAWVTDGFGYCQSTNKYKIVRIYYRKRGVGDVLVYTIGSHEWRNVGTVHHDLRSSRGIFVNGVLHWLNSDVREHKVFGFDLEDEKIRMLPMPPHDPYCEPFGKNPLKLLGGNLCFVRRDFDDCIEIWAFKRNNNNMEEHCQTSACYYDDNLWSWIKEFSIESMDIHFFEPFAVTRSNQVLLWHRHNTLYSYDPEASTLNKIWDDIMDNGMRCSSIEVFPHTNSFFSLKDHGETSIEVIPHTNSFISLKDHGESGDKSCKYQTRGYTKQAKRKSIQHTKHAKRKSIEPYESWYARMMAAGFE